MGEHRAAAVGILRAGSGLVLPRYAEKRFALVEARIGPVGSGDRRKVGKADYEAAGVIFLRPEARFSALQALTEGDNIGKAVNAAMGAIEDENADLEGALPATYTEHSSASELAHETLAG